MPRPKPSLPFLATLLFIATFRSYAEQPVIDAHSEGGLAYDLTGQGPLIVLIHATNLDRQMWGREVTWLGEHAKVLNYDLRGQGQSDFPKEPYSNHADLIALLDELGEQHATLIGLSAGAQVALDVALQVPGRVNKLILISPSLSGYIPKEMPPYLNDLMTALRARDFKQANEILIASSIMQVPNEHADLVRTMVIENERLWTIPYTLVQQATPPAIKRLTEIQNPTLILTGQNDVAAIRNQAKLLQAELPNSRVVEIPDGNHLLNLTSPQAFQDEIEAFLK